MYISFMASFLKPSHLNLKFGMRIVWFIVIKTSKNSENECQVCAIFFQNP